MIAIVVLMSALLDAAAASSEDVSAVTAVLERFEAAWNCGDIEAMLSVYTDPHIDVNHPRQIVSRKETGAMLSALRPGHWHRIAIVSDEVVVESGFAFQRGSYVLTPTQAGAAAGRDTITKRYLEILRRDKDGNWRVWWSMDGSIVL